MSKGTVKQGARTAKPAWQPCGQLVTASRLVDHLKHCAKCRLAAERAKV